MKTALVTVLNDSYILGALTTFYSVLKHTSNFNSDIIILDWGELNDTNKQKLKNLYNKVIFKPLDIPFYEKCEYDTFDRKWTYNCNYRFDIFCLEEYDKVIFIDSDFLNLTSIEPLFNLKEDFSVVKGITEYVPQYKGTGCFDAGLMVVGKRYLKSRVRDELIKLSLSPAPPLKTGSTLWASDEPILNTYFEKMDKNFISQQYNFLTSLLTKETDIYNNNFQFNGPLKPWMSTRLEDCFNEFTRQRILNQYGTATGLLILLRLHRLYLKYMNEAIRASS
jgi:lipopolysaccharide biosynthesis glycosyltransferase